MIYLVCRYNSSSYKYIFTPGNIDELYDLAADPYELNNLINDNDYKETGLMLQEKLMSHLMKEKDPLRFTGGFMLESGDKYTRQELAGVDHFDKI